MSQSHQFFCVIANGLERAVALELTSKGLPAHISTGGVYTRTTDEQVYLLTELRTPTTIRWQLINGKAVRTLSDLRKNLDSIDWSVFPKHCNVQVKTSTRKSKLNRSDIVEEKTVRFLKAVLGAPNAEASSLRVQVRIFENKLWVSVALHDRPLHQRGWRTSNVKTPIRENWAQCLLWLAELEQHQTLLDPFCGSGTLLIEAGLRCVDRNPFQSSPWVFQTWTLPWRESTWASSPSTCRLLGADRDAPSVEKARSNAKDVDVQVDIVACGVRKLTREHFVDCPEQGVVVCNPPYGMGSGRRTDAVYHWLGQTHRAHFVDWPLFFIATDVHKAKLVSKTATSVAQFSNAGIPVTFYRA